MPNSINLVSERTFFKRLSSYLILGASVIALASTPKLIEKNNIRRDYAQKVEKIETMIKDGKVDEAGVYLSELRERGVLKSPEHAMLETSLGKKKIEIELNKIKQEKDAKIAELNGLITAKKHDEAQQLYSQLLGEKVIDGPSAKGYALSINGLSLESLLAGANSKTGAEKIKAIEEICSVYTNYSGIGKLRERQAREYVDVASAYLEVNADINEVSNLLEEFIKWTGKQNSETFQDIKTLELCASGKRYLENQKKKDQNKDKNRELHIGDKVIIARKMGSVRGCPNEYYLNIETRKYSSHRDQVVDVSLNSEGFIGKLLGDDSYVVWINSKKDDYVFVYNEIEKVSNIEKESIIARIYQQLQVIGNLSGEKK